MKLAPALLGIVLGAATIAGCSATAPVTTEPSAAVAPALPPTPSAAPPITPATTTRPAPASPKTTTRKARPTTTSKSTHKVGSGYDPTDPGYQGADDPGTSAGRPQTSGESQQQWGCEQGYIPASEC